AAAARRKRARRGAAPVDRAAAARGWRRFGGPPRAPAVERRGGGTKSATGPAGPWASASPPETAHVTLLVESAEGYRNLCRLLTEAHSHTRDNRQRDAEQPW